MARTDSTTIAQLSAELKATNRRIDQLIRVMRSTASLAVDTLLEPTAATFDD